MTAVATRFFEAGRLRLVLLICAVVAAATSGQAERGGDLWLRYARVPDPAQLRAYRQLTTAIVVRTSSPTGRVIAAEMTRGVSRLLGVDVPVAENVERDGAVVIGTPSQSTVIAALGWTDRLGSLGDEGYLIRSTTIGAGP